MPLATGLPCLPKHNLFIFDGCVATNFFFEWAIMLTKKAGWLLLKNMDFGLVGFWERKFFFGKRHFSDRKLLFFKEAILPFLWMSHIANIKCDFSGHSPHQFAVATTLTCEKRETRNYHLHASNVILCNDIFEDPTRTAKCPLN